MTIAREYGINGDRKLRYNLLESRDGGSLNNCVGQKIQIKAYVLITDTNPETAEVTRRLRLLTTDNEILGTSSSSFIQGLERYLDCMESDELTELEVSQGTSKAGRRYLTFKAPID